VLRTDFAYVLPEELIAQQPLARRSASRMLVLDGSSGKLADRAILDLPTMLAAGDLLIFNDTRVVAARLIGMKPSGGRVEIFLERPLEDNRALAQMRASKPIREEMEIATAGGAVRVIEKADELWVVQLPAPALEFFDQFGDVPLPPYIRRAAGEADRQRYQSIFARRAGAVAAPTASLHFDEELLAQLEDRGVQRTFLTLHVGAGTFQPVRVDDLAAHQMHSERVTVSEETCTAIARTKMAGKRVIAVGTTVMRALESRHPLEPYSGETALFIRPGFQFKIVDALLTNFHLPESTLLMLVCAFAGTKNVLSAYAHAVKERYRFFSYGDAMFVRPQDSREI
jgi:S-adenosylmethionine:tRNA ribosyltransferase-isomerase